MTEIEKLVKISGRLDMAERVPRYYGYVIVLLVLAIGAVLAWNYLRGAESKTGGVTGPLEERSKELEEKERRIRALEDQIAQLQKELEARSNKVAELQARLEQVGKTLSSKQQKMTAAVRPAERSTPASPAPEAKVAAPAEPSAPAWRKAAEAGSYEVIRPTAVFAEPSDSSRKVSTVKKGTRVTVVGSVGDWLEVRSKHGNPPGFIRRDDAMFVAKQD